jgi:hypothetical protein
LTFQVGSYNISEDRIRNENTDTRDISYRFGSEHAGRSVVLKEHWLQAEKSRIRWCANWEGSMPATRRDRWHYLPTSTSSPEMSWSNDVDLLGLSLVHSKIAAESTLNCCAQQTGMYMHRLEATV